MRIVTILLMGGAMLTLGAWIFFEHLVFVWATVVSVIVKGTLFVWIFSLLQRWFWTGLPRLVLSVLFRIGIPAEIQRKVRRGITLSKLWMIRTKNLVVGRAQTMFGKRTALLLAILATITIGVLAFVFMGAYVVWIVGPTRIFTALEWLLAPGIRWVQNFLFRILANTGLIRLWVWLVGLVPGWIKNPVRGVLFDLIRWRRHVFDKIEDKLKRKTKRNTN